MNQLQVERIKELVIEFDYYNMKDSCESEKELIKQIELANELDIINYLLDLVNEF